MSAEDESGFLSRWARRKADARRGVEPQAPPAPVAARTMPPAGHRQAVAPAAAVAETRQASAVAMVMGWTKFTEAPPSTAATSSSARASRLAAACRGVKA
ncbi:MAG TPA: DUF3306 domain-containing protein, partial [Rubrivivax sp.]|nr:DUF3306 domain-containing protein [Rubrivivax sp.]